MLVSGTDGSPLGNSLFFWSFWSWRQVVDQLPWLSYKTLITFVGEQREDPTLNHIREAVVYPSSRAVRVCWLLPVQLRFRELGRRKKRGNGWFPLKEL